MDNNEHELTLIIQDKQNVRAERSRNRQTLGTMEFDDLRLATIKIFDDWLRKGAINRRDELEVLGTHLYKGLFVPSVESFFEQALQDARTAGERLCIRLQFQKAAGELSSLPWEYLYYPDTENRGGFFLSTDVRLVLAHYVPLSDSGDSTILEPDRGMLRILIVTSEPADVGPTSASEVTEAIEKLTEKYPIKTFYLDKPTIENFQEKLQETKPHVLHFIGHGRYRQTAKRGEIALLKRDGKSVEWCSDQSFTGYFLTVNWFPRLVFLHLCQGALVREDVSLHGGSPFDSSEFIANFAVFAPKLILASIQAVVAMQHPIANQAAIFFCRAFYRKLAEGEDVDDAVQAGRRQIFDLNPEYSSSRVFGTPVLYMNRSNGIIQRITDSRKAPNIKAT